ncbi:MAG: polymer-forming cytoskeletal protein [Hyphomicrobium sp.]|uniref:bactofilin family protein n=1 Tax=Hyphomicrobium sp. CS1BSMeth3 TaxID=1892844 RepID=UPI0009300D46|nr:polymer-forming cytoskeletal protein [Hyphomicrobium sp. CS1BSMeth3]MBN9280078.1 polymer-forming cytoskeletal protein [Hyphomicrobium sp.]
MFTKKSDREPTAFDVPRGVPPQAPTPHSHQAESPSSIGRQSAPSPRTSVASGASHIGEDLTIVGNLVSKGEVHIDGQVQGDLHAANIIIGETARVTGGVVADEVIVRGSVSGSIRGRRVVLQTSSRVEGDVFHQQLGIEQGAYFEGKSRRVADPLSGVNTPETPGPAGPGFPLRGES